MKITPVDKEVVAAYAQCNMRRNEAAEKLYMHSSSVDYHLTKVRKLTGLDPRRFCDLVKLLERFDGKAEAG